MEPGWPFAPAKIDFREGRIETFSDWLTAPENPLFARVAVNRLWQWHFGEGLAEDFQRLRQAGRHARQSAVARLAGLRVRRPQVQHEGDAPADGDVGDLQAGVGSGPHAARRPIIKADPQDTYLWHFRLQRLEAEPIWDSILTAAGNLDLTVGGPSFSIGGGGRRGEAAAAVVARRRRQPSIAAAPI